MVHIGKSPQNTLILESQPVVYYLDEMVHMFPITVHL